MPSFSIDIEVSEQAIDELGHVNNVIYLDWVQKVSQEHWVAMAPEKMRKEGFWVVLSHYIAYKSPAFKGEKLRLTTWVTQMQGVKSERHVEISRIKDERLIAKAVTLWCYVDPEKQRPKRITSEMAALFLRRP